MDIVGAIAATTGALQIVRELRELDAALDKVALKAQMVDLMGKLADVKLALLDAQAALREKDAEIANARAAMRTQAATVVKNGFRYRESPEDPGEPYGYPFCTRCEEIGAQMVSTINSPRERGAVCPQCKTLYVDATKYLLTSEMR